MKLAAAGALMIMEMSQALWALRGGEFEFMDFVDGAHRFSREVEHSDGNKNCLEHILSANQAFSLKNFLAALGCV